MGELLHRSVVSRLLIIVVAYLLLLATVRVFESRLVFFPNYPSRLEGDWHPRGLDVEDVWLTTADRIRLHAWWIASDKARITFLAFHGNASNIANRAPVYEFLRGLKANVLAVEYRGYGRSQGKPGEAGLYRDADAAYEYLVHTKGIDPKQIVSFGQSIGTAVATRLAARRRVAGLVLEAPFPSAARVASKVYWFLPGLSLLLRGQFDTQVWIKQIHVPVLVVHCTRDPVLPFPLGKEVFDVALPPKTFVEIDGDCHEESSIVGPARYRTALQDFLNSLE